MRLADENYPLALELHSNSASAQYEADRVAPRGKQTHPMVLKNPKNDTI